MDGFAEPSEQVACRVSLGVADDGDAHAEL
jgi:hypothetical protein